MADRQIATKNCDDSTLVKLIGEVMGQESVVIFLEGPQHCGFFDSLPADFELSVPELWQVRVFNEQLELAARRITFGAGETWRLRVIGLKLPEDVGTPTLLKGARIEKSLGMLGTFRTTGDAGENDGASKQPEFYKKNGFYEDRYRKLENVTRDSEGKTCREPGIAYPVDSDECRAGGVAELQVAVYSLPDGDIVSWRGMAVKIDHDQKKTGKHDNGQA